MCLFFQWPPEVFNQSCNVKDIVEECRDKCNADLEEVKHFETATDLKNLPNSFALKCYFYCVMAECHVFKPNSTRLDIAYLMDLVEKLTREEQDIVFGLGRGCVKRIMHMKDPYEIAYTLNVCSKGNDNEVR